MSAVTDALALSALPPAGRKKRTRVEPAEITAYRAKCYVRSARLVDGRIKTEYTSGKALIAGEVANVDFVVRKPTRAIKRLFQSHAPMTTDAFADKWHVNSTTIGPEAPDVKTVIANVHISSRPRSVCVLAVIGGFCKRHFPNLRPELSSVNVHRAFSHWRCDSILVPVGGKTIVELIPK